MPKTPIKMNDIVQLKPSHRAFGDEYGLTVGKSYVVSSVNPKWNTVTVTADDRKNLAVDVSRLLKRMEDKSLAVIQNIRPTSSPDNV